MVVLCVQSQVKSRRAQEPLINFPLRALAIMQSSVAILARSKTCTACLSGRPRLKNLRRNVGLQISFLPPSLSLRLWRLDSALPRPFGILQPRKQWRWSLHARRHALLAAVRRAHAHGRSYTSRPTSQRRPRTARSGVAKNGASGMGHGTHWTNTTDGPRGP